MNEYILFDPNLRDRFLEFIADRGLSGEVRPDPIAGFVVTLPDDLADDLEEAVEDEYAALMEEQQGLVESADDDGVKTLMSVSVTPPDGQPRDVRLPARYARRLFEHFSVEEIHEIVSAIAQSAMNPVEGPMCRKPSGSGPPPAA